MKIFVALLAAAALVVAHANEAATRRLRATTHQRAEASIQAHKEPCDVCGELGGGAKMESQWGGKIKPRANLEAAHQSHHDASARAPAPANMEGLWGGKIKPPAHMEAHHHHGAAARARMEAAHKNQNHAHARASAKMEGHHAH